MRDGELVRSHVRDVCTAFDRLFDWLWHDGMTASFDTHLIVPFGIPALLSYSSISNNMSSRLAP